MKLGIKRGLVMGLAALGLFAVQAVPAGATVNAGVLFVRGSGTISPGLTATPTSQTFAFTGVEITGVGVVRKSPTVVLPTTPGGSTCNANGDSYVRDIFVTNNIITKVPETVAAGAGSGFWSCATGPLAGKGGKLIYVRVGAAVVVVLTDGGKPPTGIGALACVFIPDQVAPPVTSYQLVCAGPSVDVK